MVSPAHEKPHTLDQGYMFKTPVIYQFCLFAIIGNWFTINGCETAGYQQNCIREIPKWSFEGWFLSSDAFNPSVQM